MKDGRDVIVRYYEAYNAGAPWRLLGVDVDSGDAGEAGAPGGGVARSVP